MGNVRKKIMIEGEQRLYSEGEWVVFDEKNRPMGCMSTSAATGDDVAKAAREFWGDATEALRRMAGGCRMELMTRERWEREIYPQMLGSAERGMMKDA